jgi:hypothetical protein
MLPHGYSVIHFDSPDGRGIDTGLLYQSKYFTPTSYTNIPLYIYRDAEDNKKEEEKDEDSEDKMVTDVKSKRVYTRDQLLVTGYLDGEEISFIVNHWPSRHEGSDVTEFKRLLAAEKVIEIINNYSFRIDKELKENENEKLFIYGKKVNDFKRLDYESLYCLNIAATQELYKIINDLQKRIEILENK